ncbi:MAG TPA: Asp/Glu racemase, partial [Thalassospira sp.]|nr:Asp/Glu racemase [Thalassospira sp.]
RSVAEQLIVRGFDVTRLLGFGLENDIDMTAIPPDALLAAALQANSPDADAVFISCTAIRSAEIAERAEKLLGKPVITSNQAMIWHALNLMKYDKPVTGFGTLFDHAPHKS